jgi:hypothetical protein
MYLQFYINDNGDKVYTTKVCYFETGFYILLITWCSRFCVLAVFLGFAYPCFRCHLFFGNDFFRGLDGEISRVRLLQVYVLRNFMYLQDLLLLYLKVIETVFVV